MKADILILISLYSAVLWSSCSDNSSVENTVATSDSLETKAFKGIQVADLKVLKIENQPHTKQISISGRVIPKYQTQIISEVTGRVDLSAKRFENGNYFNKGETLLSINRKQVELQLEAEKADFFSLLTGLLPDLKSDYEQSYGTWLDYINAYAAGDSLSPLPEANSEQEKFYLLSNHVYRA